MYRLSLCVGVALATRPRDALQAERESLSLIQTSSGKQCDALYNADGTKEELDPSWTTEYVGSTSSDKCHCDCVGPECFVCKQGVLKEQNGEMTCVSQSEKIPAKTTEVRKADPCGTGGSLEAVGGKAMCVLPSDCPEPPAHENLKITLRKKCDCSFELKCNAKAGVDAEALVVGDELVCKYKIPEGKSEGGQVIEGALECRSPFKLVDGKCIHEQPCTRGTVELTQRHLACGPQTDQFVGFMFDEMIRKQLEPAYKTYTTIQQACLMNCVSVFAKMSECYEQNDMPKCLNMQVASQVKQKVTELVQRDANKTVPGSWLVQGKKGMEKLPCQALFTSKRTFSGDDGKGQWGEMTDRIRASAESHYMALQGDYHTFPKNPISCRDAFCRKVMMMQVGEKSVTSMSQCYQHCSTNKQR